jgi:hypothetical protein
MRASELGGGEQRRNGGREMGYSNSQGEFLILFL